MEPTNVQEQTEQQAPELTVTDLINIRAVLDVASRRGAFVAAELSSVGSVYDKLNNFLNAVAPAKEDQPAPESEKSE